MNFKACILALLVCCFYCYTCTAQFDPESILQKPSISQCSNNVTFLKVEKMPKLQIEEHIMVQEINNKIEFEKDRKPKFLTCKVAVNCEGEIYNSNFTMNKIGKEKANEVLKIIKRTSKFSPAKHKDEPVDCYYQFNFFVVNGKLKIYKG